MKPSADPASGNAYTRANKAPSEPSADAPLQVRNPAFFLPYDQKIEIIRQPFIPANLEKLALPHDDASPAVIVDALRKLFNPPPPLHGDRADYETWSKLNSLLVRNPQECLALSNADLWNKMLEAATGAQPSFDRLAQSQWVRIFGEVISRRAQVVEFFETAGATRNSDGSFNTLPLDQCREQLQKILGKQADLISSATIQATPLGIVLLCDRETIGRIHGPGLDGLSLRSVHDPAWDGLINIAVKPEPAERPAMRASLEGIVTHELQHAAQLLLDTATSTRVSSEVTLRNLQDALKSYAAKDAQPAAETTLRQALRAYLDYPLRISSHEIAAYLDPENPQKFLGSLRLGIDSLATEKEIMKEALWESHQTPEEKRALFKDISEQIDEARYKIFQAEALTELLCQRGVPHATIQAAFEVSTISRLDDILRAFNVPYEELNTFVSRTVIGALAACKSAQAVATHMDTFVRAQERDHMLLAETVAVVSPIVRSNTHLSKLLQSAASNRLTAIVLSGDTAAINGVDLKDVIAFTQQVDHVRNDLLRIVIASQSFGAYELLEQYDADRIIRDVNGFVKLLEGLNEGLSLCSSGVPSDFLFPCERWAIRTLQDMRSLLEPSDNPMSGHTQALVLRIIDNLQQLVAQTHQNFGSDRLFEIDPPLSVIPHTTTEMIGTHSTRLSTQEFIQSHSVFHPAWKDFESSRLDFLHLPDDLEDMLLATRHVDRLDVAYSALVRAHHCIQENPQLAAEFPSITEYGAHRALILSDCLAPYNARLSATCRAIAAAMRVPQENPRPS